MDEVGLKMVGIQPRQGWGFGVAILQVKELTRMTWMRCRSNTGLADKESEQVEVLQIERDRLAFSLHWKTKRKHLTV